VLLDRHTAVIELLVFLLVAAALGLVIGGLARFAVPGPDPMPLWLTGAIGLGGSILGGVVARILLGTTGGFLFAFAGAIVLVIAYRRFVQGRPITGPSAKERPSRGVGIRARRGPEG